MVVAVSQSGETADTLAAIEEARLRGSHILALTNTVFDSSIARGRHTIIPAAGPKSASTSRATWPSRSPWNSVRASYSQKSVNDEKSESFKPKRFLTARILEGHYISLSATPVSGIYPRPRTERLRGLFVFSIGPGTLLKWRRAQRGDATGVRRARRVGEERREHALRAHGDWGHPMSYPGNRYLTGISVLLPPFRPDDCTKRPPAARIVARLGPGAALCARRALRGSHRREEP